MKSKIAKIGIYGFLTFFAIITLMPFIWMILSSLKTWAEVTAVPPPLFPETPQWSNYPEAMSMAPFGRYFINTVIVAVGTTVSVVITSILAAFAFAKMEFKYKDFMFMAMISLMMIPGEMLVITNFQTIASLGLMNTYTAMIIPFAVNIFYIYLLRNNFTEIPNSIYLAAKVDGCSDWKFLWKILVPCCKSGIITVALLTFINTWNAFLWPFLVTDEKEMRLLNNGLIAFQTEAGSDPQLQLAAATVIIVPIIIVYLIAQKQIIAGIGGGNGGTKG